MNDDLTGLLFALLGLLLLAVLAYKAGFGARLVAAVLSSGIESRRRMLEVGLAEDRLDRERELRRVHREVQELEDQLVERRALRDRLEQDLYPEPTVVSEDRPRRLAVR